MRSRTSTRWGAARFSRLNLVAWPRDLDTSILGRVLEGAGDVCKEAGVAIVGGHSVDDPEPKFGLAVTGSIHPDEVLHKQGASAGDDLILTKPLGTGIIATALKHDRAQSDWVDKAVESMTTLNRDASEVVNEVGAHAVTDVTGFGLVGHLTQMLGESAGAEIEFSSLPLLDGTLELVADGVYPGGSIRNFDATRDRIDAERCFGRSTKGVVRRADVGWIADISSLRTTPRRCWRGFTRRALPRRLASDELSKAKAGSRLVS